MAGNEDEWQASEGMYRTFLLRCWQESDGLNKGEVKGFHNWYFTLVQIGDPSQAKCFASLEELLAFLSREFTY